jgi:hypothetical protein
MRRYDRDEDHRLDEKEFHNFLLDLAASRLLPDPGQRVSSSQASLSQVAAINSTVPEPDKQVSKGAEISSGTNKVKTEIVSSAAVTPSTSGSCPELSKELIQSFAQQGTIMLTVCDWRIFETFGEAIHKRSGKCSAVLADASGLHDSSCRCLLHVQGW